MPISGDGRNAKLVIIFQLGISLVQSLRGQWICKGQTSTGVTDLAVYSLGISCIRSVPIRHTDACAAEHGFDRPSILNLGVAESLTDAAC